MGIDAAVAHRVVAKDVTSTIVAVDDIRLSMEQERGVFDVHGVGVAQAERTHRERGGLDGNVGEAVNEDTRVAEGHVVDEAGRAVRCAWAEPEREDAFGEGAGRRADYL